MDVEDDSDLRWVLSTTGVYKVESVETPVPVVSMKTKAFYAEMQTCKALIYERAGAQQPVVFKLSKK